MKTKQLFPLPIHLAIYIVASISFGYFLDISMIDDGLRHIAFAQHQDIMQNWGTIFPHSLFSNYDPWYMWHKLLSFLLQFIPYNKVHIAINIVSLLALMILIDTYIRRYSKYDFSSLIYLVVFIITFITSHRYLMVRPDLLSGLFIMAGLLLKNRFWPIFILTLLYIPFYYLFFLYTGSLGLVFLIQKKWKLFFGILIASIIGGGLFLIQDFQGYIHTVKYILTDQSLRMGLEVGEGQPTFAFFHGLNYFILLPLFFLISSYIIYKQYNHFKKDTLGLFFIITSILWVNQVRYFDLFLPFISTYIFIVIINLNKKQLLFNIRKILVVTKSYFNVSKKATIFYIIAIPYAIAVFSFKFHNTSAREFVEDGKFFKQHYFDNKTILLNRLRTDIYKALYYNPTIKTIPSCSIGWFENNPDMKAIYIQMQKKEGISEKQLALLIKYLNVDFYIHYLTNSKKVLDFQKLKKLGIIPYKIYNDKIIFIVKKDT